MGKTIFSKVIFIFLITVININAQLVGTGPSYHGIVVNASGQVYTWGFNANGELGNSTSGTNSNVPVAVNMSGVLSGKTITKVASGYNHSIALASDGTVYTWGNNAYRQLGDGTNTSSNVPVAVYTGGALSGKTITQIAAGQRHCIALASDGTVYTWGWNSYGQLGNGSFIDSNGPVAVNTSGVLNGKTIIKVAAGYIHSVVLASDGTVYAWGNNAEGELGNGTNFYSNVPVAVNTSGALNGKTITNISAGRYHTMAVASDGTAYTWGINYDGRLGNGSNTDSNVPVAVNTSGVLSGKTIVQVAAGGYHSIALASDGTVYTWGSNGEGELGNGNNTTSNIPVAVNTSGVLNGKTITQIAAGDIHSFALASDGSVYSWGYNFEGELGNGQNTSSNVPVAVDQSFMGLLPVEIISFNAYINNVKVIINWKTSTEVNNYGFNIESKMQNEEWRTIGFVAGNGNSNSPKDYSFVDPMPVSGKIKYRLKQIDFDGSFSYSNEIEIESNIPNKFVLEQNFPNPFNPTTTIKYSIPNVMVNMSNNDNLVTLKVYDIIGRESATLVNESQPAGNYEVKFDGSKLSSGVYFYTLKYGSFAQSKKFILMK